jgi:peptidoglycan/LPS O-acetylase OafA/YrhL
LISIPHLDDKNPNFEEFVERKYFSLLNGVRALAIFAVLWHHSSGGSLANSEWAGRGYLGVDLFFILSGFLITHLLMRESRTVGTINLKKFYIRRALRIFPLYYGYLFFLIPYTLIFTTEKIGGMKAVLPYYVFFVSNWSPEHAEHFFHRAWSLAVEEQFYLIWPIVFSFFSLRISFSILIGFVLIVLLGSVEWTFLSDSNLSFFSKFVPYQTILIGCFCAFMLNQKKTYIAVTQLLGCKWASPLALFVLLVGIAVQRGDIVGFPQFLIHVAMAVFLISTVVNEKNYLREVLGSKCFRNVGMVSYGIYVLHGQFWGLTKNLCSYVSWLGLGDTRVLFFLVFSLISFFSAYLSYHFFEVFFLSVKKKY